MENELYFSEDNFVDNRLKYGLQKTKSPELKLTRKCLASDLGLPVLRPNDTKDLRRNEIYRQNQMSSGSKNNTHKKVFNYSAHEFIRNGLLKQPGKMNRSMHLQY